MQVCSKRERSRPGKFTKCCPTTISAFESLRRMDNSPSNGPQVFSTEVGENKIDYKQRCKYLENQLEKFREQAAKVREVIGQKVRRRQSWMFCVLLSCYACCDWIYLILFVSLLLFSLYSSRFRVMLELSQKKSSAVSGLQVNCMLECLFSNCVRRLIWIDPRDFLRFVLLITFQHFI